MAGTNVILVWGKDTGRGQFILDLVNDAKNFQIVLEGRWRAIQ